MRLGLNAVVGPPEVSPVRQKREIQKEGSSSGGGEKRNPEGGLSLSRSGSGLAE